MRLGSRFGIWALVALASVMCREAWAFKAIEGKSDQELRAIQAALPAFEKTGLDLDD